MIKIILERQRQELNATLGRLELPGPAFKIFCTLEPLPPVIPVGIYPLVYEYSAKFRRYLWELKNVPGHTEIKIHNGNTAESTMACVLIGMRHGTLNGQPAVLSSRFALNSFHIAMQSFKSASIEIIDLVGD